MDNIILEGYQFGAAPLRIPRNPVLYHYTSFESIFNIIKSGKIWTTQLQYLNDNKEFIQAVDIIKQVTPTLSTDSLADDEKRIYSRIIERIENMDGANSFIFSLSEEPDLLSQWRGYCKNGGVSVGFNFHRLFELAQRQDFRLLPCIYEPSEQQTLARKLIENIITEYRKNSDKYIGEKINDLMSLFYSSFLLLGTSFKHPSFREEKEWRLIGGPFSFLSSRYNFRPSANLLIPYYEFDLDFSPELLIEDFIIGPNREQMLAIKSFANFVRRTESIKDVSINRSESPFKI